MALRRWSPFADPEFHADWVGQRAMVWAWSVSGVREFDAVGVPTAPRRTLPESLFRGEPMAQGEQLLDMSSGCEGRVWHDQVMTASQWWPQVPTLQEWNLLRRGAGLAPADGVPSVLPATLHEQPWSGPRARAWVDVASRHKGLVQAAALAAGIAVFALLLVSCLHLLLARAQVDRQIAAQDASLQQILSARESAESDASAIDAVLELRPPAGIIQILSRALQLMPKTPWQLLELRLTDADSVELDVSMAQADPRAIVQAWESSGQFADVTAELGRGADELTIKARVIRAHVPSVAPAPTKSAPTQSGAAQ